MAYYLYHLSGKVLFYRVLKLPSSAINVSEYTEHNVRMSRRKSPKITLNYFIQSALLSDRNKPSLPDVVSKSIVCIKSNEKWLLIPLSTSILLPPGQPWKKGGEGGNYSLPIDRNICKGVLCASPLQLLCELTTAGNHKSHLVRLPLQDTTPGKQTRGLRRRTTNAADHLLLQV